MAANKGNKYWEFRNKHGRDFKYDPESLWDEAVEYFKYMDERVINKKEAIKSGDMAGKTMDVPTSIPFSCESFCLFADISMETFRNYQKGEGAYKDFFDVSTRIRQIIDSNQFEGAVVNIFNPNIIARKLGLGDKTILEGGDKPIQTIDYTKVSTETLKELEQAAKTNDSEH